MSEKKPRIHRCPQCRSQELVVVEQHIEVGSTDPGEVLIVDGEVIPPSDFWFAAGDPLRVDLECA